MKKIKYLLLVFVLIIAASCSMSNNNVKSNAGTTAQSTVEKKLFATMNINNTINKSDSVLLTFTVYNHTDSVKQFLKWQTPFEPLMSKYLNVTNAQGEEVSYKGAMAKRMMPPPPGAYLSLNPKDSLTARVDVLKAYNITKPGKYMITYTSESISGLKVREPVSFIYR